MIAIEYNMDEAAKGGEGCVIFPTGEVTLAKHEEGGYSLDFIDDEGGCLVSISITDNVLHNLVVLRDTLQPKASMVLGELPGPPLPEGWKPPF